MMNHSFGKNFKLSFSGESHGSGFRGSIEGVPKDIKIDITVIQQDLDRRSAGSFYSTLRVEKDSSNLKIEGLSSDGYCTSGTLGFSVANKNVNTSSYNFLDIKTNSKILFRPSHSDYPYFKKYGKTFSGGGFSSGRETLCRVIGGSIANQLLSSLLPGYEAVSFVESIGEDSFWEYKKISDYDQKLEFLSKISKNTVIELGGFLDPGWKKLVEEKLNTIKEQKDSTGGVVGTLIRGVGVGIGEPVFNKLDACLSYGVLSIPGSKGIEFGAGFLSSTLRGSRNNDSYTLQEGIPRTKTNKAGGILGGVSTGEDIYFRTAFKPASSIGLKQETISFDGTNYNKDFIEVGGRHDCCYVPRAVVVVEAMSGMVVLDLLLDK